MVHVTSISQLKAWRNINFLKAFQLFNGNFTDYFLVYGISLRGYCCLNLIRFRANFVEKRLNYNCFIFSLV